MRKILKVIEDQSLYIALSIIVLIQILLLLFNGETYGGADNVGHYQIARYAFKYPNLFLDLWGKPVYTFMVAPFSLLGFKVAKLFNLLAAILTLILTADLSRKIFKGSSLNTIILIAFSPVYFFLMITCLTEVLFSLILVATVYLFYKNKLVFSAIVLSFIPFVRSEGMVLFPVFALAFLMKRSFWPILFLAVGTVFFSLIGRFAFGDLLWIMHRFPYSMGDSIYGSGSIFHFVKNSNFIFGVPFLILLLFGLVYWLYQIIRNFSLKDENLILFIVIAGSWLSYFVAHSYVWWKGTGGSLGLTRVIGAVIPLAALTAVKGIQFILERIKNRYIAKGIVAFLMAAQIFLLFIKNDMPVKSSPVDALIQKSIGYLKEVPTTGKVFYFNPEFVFYLGVDPYDQSKCNWGISDKLQPSNSMQYGDLIIWDAHFGPNEGGVLLNNLMIDPHLQLTKSILPIEPFKVLGGYDYGIYIYRKVEQKAIQEQKPILTRELAFGDSSDEHLVVFEGKKFLNMDENLEFSQAIPIPVSEIQANDYVEVSASVKFFPKVILNADNVLLVLSVDDDHKPLSYNKIDLVVKADDVQHWQEITFPMRLNADLPKGAIVNLYVWNKDKKSLLLDNLKLTLTGF